MTKEFDPAQYEMGRQYREIWYQARNHEMVFAWSVLSEPAKRNWVKEALTADGEGA